MAWFLAATSSGVSQVSVTQMTSDFISQTSSRRSALLGLTERTFTRLRVIGVCSRPKLFCGTQGTETRFPVLRHDRETLGLSGFCAEPVERKTWSLGAGLSLKPDLPPGARGM